MKKVVLLTAVLLLTATCLAQGQEGELHGTVDLTYLSKYVWRGFDVFGDKSAIQPSVNLDLFGTGLGFSIMGHRANSSGFENTERWDWTLHYRNSLLDDKPYATQYMIGWVYYNYPDSSTEVADLQEIHTVLSWPKLLQIEGLVPTYCIVKLWPSRSGSLVASRVDLTTGLPSNGTASGWAHIFMLDYGLKVPGFVPETPEQVINLHMEVVYNDGVGPAGQMVDHDWSNAVFGISTSFDLGNNLSFTPALYYQSSWDDSVNDEDEFWVSLGMAYKF